MYMRMYIKIPVHVFKHVRARIHIWRPFVNLDKTFHVIPCVIKSHKHIFAQCMYMQIRTHTYTHMHTHTHTHTHTYVPGTHTCTRTYIPTYLENTHVHAHTYIRAWNTHMYTHIIHTWKPFGTFAATSTDHVHVLHAPVKPASFSCVLSVCHTCATGVVIRHVC
jgi:hypothetical protein